MSHRIAQPGEDLHLSPGCGVHCGIRSAAEGGDDALRIVGHCGEPCCNCPEYGTWAEWKPYGYRGVPMCDS